MTELAYQTNPTARRLFDEVAKATKKTGPQTVKDSGGDTWCRKSGVRNKSHPLNSKNFALPVNTSAAAKEPPPSVPFWHNQRTGEVHEGPVTVRTDGRADMSDGSFSNPPRYYHISHYK